MCGITGFAERNHKAETARRIVKGMADLITYRGPDGEGYYVDDQVALGHRRLSIIDLEGGKQPMFNEDQNLAVIFNGEIYNFQELTAELMRAGHTFATRSDTEVLLHGYEQWGKEMLQKLRGMFTFAIWDRKNETLFCARDHFGIKPFYYYQNDAGELLFGSEIKTLLAHPAVPPRVDANGLAEVLLLGPGRTPGCGVFRNVQELKPGCCAEYTVPQVGAPRLTVRRYWQLTDHEHPDDFTHTAAKVRDLVMDAVTRQLVSDVPVATFLSGGLDSSLISAIADSHFTARGKTLQTFSVGYQDNKKYFHATHFQPSPDAPYIRTMNQFLNAQHTWVTLDSEALAAALLEAVDARDLPGMADVDSSLLLFCREIRKTATVALSGECADEIFGGYPWYRDKTVRERYGFPWAQSTAYRVSFFKPEVFGGIDPAAYIDEGYRATLEQTSIRPGLDPLEQRMRQMFALNFNWFMQTLLDRKDRMSMYSGLEVRVPFCDYRIAEYLYSVPWEYKDYEGHEKGLLRQAMQGVLPTEVLWRKKSPYPKTWNPAYLNAVSAMLRSAMQDPDAPLLRIAKRAALEQLLTAAETATPWYGQLMTTPQTIAWFVQLNYWLQKYRVELV